MIIEFELLYHCWRYALYRVAFWLFFLTAAHLQNFLFSLFHKQKISVLKYEVIKTLYAFVT